MPRTAFSPLQRAAVCGDAPALRRLAPAGTWLTAWAHVLDSDFEAGRAAAEPLTDLAGRAAHLLAATMDNTAAPGALDALAGEGLSMTPGHLDPSERGEPWAQWGLCLLGEAAMSAGRLDLAESVALHTLAIGDRADAATVFTAQTLARALLFQGRLAEAGDALDLARAHPLYSDVGGLKLVVAGTSAYLAALADDRVTLDRSADEIDAETAVSASSYLTRGALVLSAYALAAGGRGERAATVLLAGAGGPRLSALQHLDRVYGYELLIAASLSVGDLRRARTWLRVAERTSGADPTGMAGAALQRSMARVAVAEGRHGDSAVVAARAAELAGGRAGHLDATRAHLLAAQALLQGGDSATAQLRLQEAGVQATLMGAVSLTLLARRDLRSIGLRFAGADQEPMSQREREVAELVISGLSNAEIARELNLSERTVHGHVRAVLRALGVPSRAGLARSLGASTRPDAPDLTDRQRQVAVLVRRGYTNDGIARELGVSVKTVEKHIGDAYRRLGVRSRAALAATVVD